MKKANNYLENQVDLLINFLIQTNKGYGWKNHPYRNHQGVYIEGEKFDYTIILPHLTMYFDCKMKLKGNAWSIRAKDKKQAINLKKIQELNDKNIECFFLIYFAEYLELKKIHINKVFEILSSKNTIYKQDCELFKLKEVLNLNKQFK